MTDHLLEAAIAYAKKGYSVVPAEANGKEPMILWTPFQQARADEAQLREWWTKWPDANIAIVTGRISGLVVVDVDSAELLEQALEAGPTDYIVQTSRGYHLYYRYPPQAERISNRVGDDGIDVRGDGGIVIVPPSIHANGHIYSLYRDGPMGEAPAWLLDEIVQTGGARSHWIASMLVGGLEQGQRNTGAARLSGYLCAKKMPLDVTIALLQSWNARNQPPLPYRDVARIAESVYRTAQRRSPFRPAGESELSASADAVSDAERTFVVDQWDDKDENEMDAGLIQYSTYLQLNAGEEERWMVEGWLPDATLAMIVAAPGSYKTWLALDLAISVAGKHPFMGAPVLRPGPVLLLQQEDPKAEISKRMSIIHFSKLWQDLPIYESSRNGANGPAAGILRTLPDLPLYLSTANTFSLLSQPSLRALERNIQDLKPVLVILDPLYTAGAVDDYLANTAKRMSILKALRDHYGCSFVIVHHTKKAAREDRGKTTANREDVWGSQFLNAALETGWQVRRATPYGNQVVITRHFKAQGAREPLVLDFSIQELPNGRTYYCPTEVAEATAADALLVLLGDGPLTAAQMVMGTGLSRTTVNRRLKALVEEGSVIATENGTFELSASLSF